MEAFFQNSMRLFGPFHLIFTAIGVPLAIGGAVMAANLCKNARKKPGAHSFPENTVFYQNRCQKTLLLLWTIFILMELWKQLALERYVGSGERYWYIPFQLCSMPLYLCPIAGFCRKSRLKQAVCCFLSGYSLLGGFLTLAFPEDILIRPLPFAVHGFVWHLLLILLGVFLVLTGYGKTQSPLPDSVCRVGPLSAVWDAGWVMLVCSCIALTLNLLLWEPSGHSINLFYLGPMPNSQPVFCEICKRYGWGITAICYLACCTAGGDLLCLPYQLKKLSSHKKAANYQPI